MPQEPDLSTVHADLVGRLEHDKRLRQLEQQQAATTAILADLPRMEDRLVRAIQESRPRNVAQWAAVLVSALAVVVAIVALTATR